jgi:DnaJ-class molecular chaperone
MVKVIETIDKTTRQCMVCDGTGCVLYYLKETCLTCNGTGRMRKVIITESMKYTIESTAAYDKIRFM